MSIVKFKPKPLKLVPEIIGSFAVSAITTQSIAVGTPVGVQLFAIFQFVLTEPFHTFAPLIVTVVSSISLIVLPSHNVYVISAVYTVVEVGHTLSVGDVPTTGPVVPDPSYQAIDAIEFPLGTKRHASFAVAQFVSKPFLPGATLAKVPVAF